MLSTAPHVIMTDPSKAQNVATPLVITKIYLVKIMFIRNRRKFVVGMQLSSNFVNGYTKLANVYQTFSQTWLPGSSVSVSYARHFCNDKNI